MNRHSRIIQSIILHHFQSHVHSQLDLSKGVNVITGPSDVGKSAILRALRWLFFNEPRGQDFIRHGTKETYVQAIYDDGVRVTRKRNTSFNGYIIEQNGQQQEFQGFGAGVPDEVIHITGVRKFVLSDTLKSAITLQSQLEGSFLLGEANSQKAKAIGSISGVNILDEAASRANLARKKANQDFEDHQKKGIALKEEMAQFDDLPIKRASIEKAEQLFQLAVAKHAVFAQQEDLSLKFNMIDPSIQEIQELLKKLSVLDDVQIRLPGTSIVVQRLTQYIDLSGQWKKNTSALEAAFKRIDCTRNIASIEQNIHILHKKIENFKDLISTYMIEKESAMSKHVADDILYDTKHISDTLSLFQKITNMKDMSEKIADLRYKWHKYQSDQHQAKLFYDSSASLQNLPLCEMTQQISKYNAMFNLSQLFVQIDRRVQKGYLYMQQMDVTCKEAEERYEECFKQLEYCPLCGAPLDKHKHC